MHARLLHLHQFNIRAMAVSAALCALCAFAYGAFLLLAVTHTASRANAQESLVALTSAMGVLQEKYFSRTALLTPLRAAELGLVRPLHTESIFAHGDPSLSLRNGLGD